VNTPLLKLVLADDDTDDCTFFKEALEELSHVTKLEIVHDGVALMRRLIDGLDSLPHVIYLDLNMPLKTGFDCLAEIKKSEMLKHVPVIIFSTSFNPEVVKCLHERGATFYIRKPGDFSDLKKIIAISLDLIMVGSPQPSAENFVLNSER